MPGLQSLLHNQNALPTSGFAPCFLPATGGAESFPSSWQWAASKGLLLSSHLVKGSPVPGKFSVQTSTKKKLIINPRNKDAEVNYCHYHNQESHSGQGLGP